MTRTAILTTAAFAIAAINLGVQIVYILGAW